MNTRLHLNIHSCHRVFLEKNEGFKNNLTSILCIPIVYYSKTISMYYSYSGLFICSIYVATHFTCDPRQHTQYKCKSKQLSGNYNKIIKTIRNYNQKTRETSIRLLHTIQLFWGLHLSTGSPTKFSGSSRRPIDSGLISSWEMMVQRKDATAEKSFLVPILMKIAAIF